MAGILMHWPHSYVSTPRICQLSLFLFLLMPSPALVSIETLSCKQGSSTVSCQTLQTTSQTLEKHGSLSQTEKKAFLIWRQAQLYPQASAKLFLK